MTIITAIGENLALGKDNRSLRGRKPLRSGFREYLKSQDVTSIDDLAYIINDTKTTVPEVKQAFKELFTAKADDLFKPVEEGGVGIEKIKQLFGNDINDVEDFLEKIETIENNPIYNFIKSE